VGRTLGEELERTLAIVTKQKKELAELANSLKAALEANEALKEKIFKDNDVAEKAQKTLKDELAVMEAKKADLAKEKAATEEREKTLSTEVEKCHAFMLRISKDCFYQGLRQATFYHGVPVEDPRYNLDKDMVNDKLVPIDGSVVTPMDVGGENDATPQAEPEPSFEEILEPF